MIPAVGPVEPVSAYRNPLLNVCAGGAPESAHKHYSAIDLVPLRPTTREELMQTLCAVHARRGPDYGVGLGFYAFLRFHVDTTKFRRWGADPGSTHLPADHPPGGLSRRSTSRLQPVPCTAADAPVVAPPAPVPIRRPPAPPQPEPRRREALAADSPCVAGVQPNIAAKQGESEWIWRN